ncbi:cardiolipin synthase [Bacillus sp. S13(2024)]|uniref:cardiolipin synthase n=1 Tax=unclassified Bacillus (in: firmicutes) TaxID=185979 RepID=UPI003D1E1B67
MRQLLVLLLCIGILVIWMNADVEVGRNSVKENQISQIRYGDFKLYVDGNDLYRDLFADIDRAKQYIYLHFYIVGKDKVSKKFLQLLKQKAASGVDVKLSVDRVGGYKINKKTIQELEQSGVQFTFSKKPRFKNFFYTLHNRNHRRIAVVDGNISYVGGFNIGNEYLGEDRRFGKWRDYHVRITGSGAQDMKSQFAKDWELDTGKELSPYEITAIQGSNKYRYVFTDGKGLWTTYYKEMIQSAKTSIVIATPYFVPSKEMMTGLQNALQRGVRLQILVPFKSDALLLKQAAYSYLEKLLRFGAEIYQYRDGFFHGKVTLIDDKFADIGTANFDNRSFYINAESDCFIYEGKIIGEIQRSLQRDFQEAKQFSEKDFEKMNMWDKFLARVSKVLSFYL